MTDQDMDYQSEVENNASSIGEMETFDLREGMIESDAEQSSVDSFAADFQGIRHFGEKIGSLLNLGIPWMGALQEEQYSIAYSTPLRDTEGLPDGQGARVLQRALLFEMMSQITPSADS